MRHLKHGPHPPAIYTAAQIRTAANLPQNPEKLEVRVYGLAFTLTFMALLLFPAISVLTDVDAPIVRVAHLSHAPQFIGALFLLCILATLPHVVLLMFLPSRLYEQWPRQMAAGGASVAALLWCYIANLSEPLDMDPVTMIYWAEAFMSGGVGFLYGFSLNAQQVRTNEKQAVG